MRPEVWLSKANGTKVPRHQQAPMLLTPSLFGFGRDAVALLGSAASTLLVFGLVRRRGFSAISIVLAGLVVGLYCGALSAILVLVKDRYLASLFTTGFEIRLLSSSFCCRRLARYPCQS